MEDACRSAERSPTIRPITVPLRRLVETEEGAGVDNRAFKAAHNPSGASVMTGEVGGAAASARADGPGHEEINGHFRPGTR
jgi:hypothetical protein